MQRQRHIWIAAGSLVLSGLLVYGLYWFQVKQIEWQETIHVVVPSTFVDTGTMLTEDMLEYKPLVLSAYDERMVTDLEYAAGLETAVPLAEGEPLMDWKLDLYQLMPREGQMTFQIPKAYILAIANEIRSGDRVKIYATSEQQTKPLFEEPVVVASVRSASNVEVTDTGQTHLRSKAAGDFEQMYLSRRDANASIDQLNLNLTEEQWIQLDEMCSGGEWKLVIAYTKGVGNNAE